MPLLFHRQFVRLASLFGKGLQKTEVPSHSPCSKILCDIKETQPQASAGIWTYVHKKKKRFISWSQNIIPF